MSTQHDQHSPIRPPTHLTTRCFRHRAWMAACGDCRDAHHEQLTRTPPSAS